MAQKPEALQARSSLLAVVTADSFGQVMSAWRLLSETHKSTALTTYRLQQIFFCMFQYLRMKEINYPGNLGIISWWDPISMLPRTLLQQAVLHLVFVWGVLCRGCDTYGAGFELNFDFHFLVEFLIN